MTNLQMTGKRSLSVQLLNDRLACVVVASLRTHMGIVESVQLFQADSYHQRSVKWNRLSIEAQERAVRISVIRTVREDLADRIEMVRMRIDTFMLLNTLMLEASFGFVYCGTFEPFRQSLSDTCGTTPYALLVTYTCGFVLALTFPVSHTFFK
tara:strand:+ start:70 stop:528 length:459 start_codon:yes stop_codon:yes gene_type:complete